MDQSAIYGGSHGGGESLPRTALGGTRGQTVKEFDEQAVGVTNEINFNQVVPDEKEGEEPEKTLEALSGRNNQIA